MLYNPKAHTNLISAAFMERHFSVAIISHNNITLAYHDVRLPYDIVLKFQLTDNGIFVVSLKPLINIPQEFIPVAIYFPLDKYDTIRANHQS